MVNSFVGVLSAMEVLVISLFIIFLAWTFYIHISNDFKKMMPVKSLAGEIALVAGLVIWITSLPQVRRKRFEIFYYTHHLYTIFIVFFLFHTGDRHFYMVFPAIFLFAIERLLRMIQSRQETCILSARIFPFKAIEVINGSGGGGGGDGYGDGSVLLSWAPL